MSVRRPSTRRASGVVRGALVRSTCDDGNHGAGDTAREDERHLEVSPAREVAAPELTVAHRANYNEGARSWLVPANTATENAESLLEMLF
jgi:hypothetical protein